MRGFILAAGFGTRLLPLTEHIPKALVSVCGIPLLQRAHDFLAANGMEGCAVNSHHHPEQVELFVKSHFPEVRIFHEQPEIRGTGGALFHAKEYLGSADTFCVANVDIITNANLAKLAIDFLESSSVVGCVAAPSDNGTIRYDPGTGAYAGVRAGTRENAVGKSADFIGITFYRKEFLSVLQETDFSIIPVWERAREKGMRVSVLETGPVYWNDVGSPGNLAKLHFDVLEGTIGLSAPASMVVDTKGKKAYPGSFGPRRASRVGPYAWINAAEIPDDTTFSRAVVFSDAVVPHGVHIENSIVTKYGVLSFDKKQ